MLLITTNALPINWLIEIGLLTSFAGAFLAILMCWYYDFAMLCNLTPKGRSVFWSLFFFPLLRDKILTDEMLTDRGRVYRSKGDKSFLIVAICIGTFAVLIVLGAMCSCRLPF